MTPEEMSARNRIGGLWRAATGDMGAMGRRSQELRLIRLEDEIDPYKRLPPHERRRKAELMRKAQLSQAARKRWAKHNEEKRKAS